MLLVALCGLMGLLFLVSLALVKVASRFAQSAGSTLSVGRAALAASSGCEYAGARLWRDGNPRHSATAADRGDDWTFRDPSATPLETALNPSYAHGRSWLDATTVPDGIDNDEDCLSAAGGLDEAGEIDRLLVPGEAPSVGKVPSGRLRGGAGGLLFRLRIEAPEGKIPVNWGAYVRPDPDPALDGADNDSDGTVDERGEGYDEDEDGYWDCPPGAQAGSMPLFRNALDHLGVACGIRTRRWDVPAGVGGSGDPVRLSWLGYDLLERRPIGGYRSWEHLVGELTNLPPDTSVPPGFKGAPYDAAELEAARPYLDLAPPGRVSEGRLCLSTAPREVLRACWTYLQARSPSAVRRSFLFGVLDTFPANDFYGEAEGGAKVCPRSGLAFGPAPPDPSSPPYVALLTLFPEEAARLADATSFRRQKGGLSWGALRRLYDREAALLFERDFAALSAGAPSPVYARRWVRSKAAFAFQSFAVDRSPARGIHGPLMAWATGGDADSAPSMGESTCLENSPELYPSGIRRPAAFDPANPNPWGGAPYIPYWLPRTDTYRDPVRLRFTLAPPRRFEVQCLGEEGASRAWRGGELVPGDRLELSTKTQLDGTFSATLALSADPYGAVALAPKNPGRGDSRLCWEGIDRSCSWDPAYLPQTVTPSSWPPSRYGLPTINLPPTTGTPPKPAIPWATGPFGMTTSSNVILQMPGFDPYRVRATRAGFPDKVWAGVVSDFTVECWMGPDSLINVQGPFAGIVRMQVKTVRAYDAATGRPGTRFTLWLYGYRVWWNRYYGPGDYRNIQRTSIAPISVPAPLEWFVPDDPARPRSAYHTVLAMRRTGVGTLADPYVSHFDLAVNGNALPTAQVGGDLALPFPERSGGLMVPEMEHLAIQCIDDLRLYDGYIFPPPRDRCERKGSFLSKVVAPGGRLTLGQAQWTGIFPAGMLRPGSPPSIEVDLIACDAAGTELARVPLGKEGETSEIGKLGFPSNVEAFRYEVRLDCEDEPGPLRDTPVFESIWFTFQRAGVARWASYTAR